MSAAVRVLLTIVACAVCAMVLWGDDRGGMPLEARAIVLLGLGALVTVIWLVSTGTPWWTWVLTGVALSLWAFTVAAWLDPVDSVYGSCGSSLVRRQPASDGDGECDWLVADVYNQTIPVFLSAVVVSVVAAVGVMLARRRGSTVEASGRG